MGDGAKSKIYLRQHSKVIRKWPHYKEIDLMHENPLLHVEGDAKIILTTICRIRQRLLQQAWNLWTENANVIHDYESDIRTILSRKLPENSLRTELEIEVLYKWVAQTKDLDPTGISSTIYMCKKNLSIYHALQQIRLEYFEPLETILFQADLPRPEDGHFTILRGDCEVLQFEDDSVPLLKLQYLAKNRKWDEAKRHLKSAQILAKIGKLGGFGELSTLTNVKRAASIRTAKAPPGFIYEILVLPKESLLELLRFRRDSGEGNTTSEAIDFMRQSGLANRISPKDLVQAAGSMVRRTLYSGDILYCKGELVKSIYLVISGEFLLDIGDNVIESGKVYPFMNANIDNCFHLSAGSLLGDEGVSGSDHRFESTAVVVSDVAVVFEAVGFGLSFLAERIGALRYCALAYKNKPRWTTPVPLAEQMNPYTYFNSLRKAIAYTHPFRGALPKSYVQKEVATAHQNMTQIGESKVESTIGQKTSTEAQVKSEAENLTSSKNKNLNTNKSNVAFDLDANNQKQSNMKKPLPRQIKSTIKNTSKKSNTSSNESAANIIAQSTVMGVTQGFQLAPQSLKPNGENQPVSTTVNDVIHIENGIEYPRKLLPIALHYALEINNVAKKMLQHYVKIHAKENILLDQLMKIPPSAQDEAERQFKKAIGEYRTRELHRARQQSAPAKAEEVPNTMTRKFFILSTSNENSVDGDNFEGLQHWEGKRKHSLKGKQSPYLNEENNDNEDDDTESEQLYDEFEGDISKLVEDERMDRLKRSSVTRNQRNHEKILNEELKQFQQDPDGKKKAPGSADRRNDGITLSSLPSLDKSLKRIDKQQMILKSLKKMAKEKSHSQMLGDNQSDVADHDGDMLNMESLEGINSLGSFISIAYDIHSNGKIEQYFAWLDNLSRTRYFELVKQVEVSLKHSNADHELLQKYHLDPNSHLHHDEDDATNREDRLQLLKNVFKEFGLTPHDLNIPVASTTAKRKKTSTPKMRSKSLEVNGKLVLEEKLATKTTPKLLENTRSPTRIELPNESQSAFSPIGSPTGGKSIGINNVAIPGLQLSSPHPETTAMGPLTTSHKGRASINNKHANDSSHGMDTGNKFGDRTAARKSVHFKTYTPSSWRADIIRGKALDLSHESHVFIRPMTSNNRRTANYYVIPEVFKFHPSMIEMKRKEAEILKKTSEKEEEKKNRMKYERKRAGETFHHNGDCYDFIESPQLFLEAVQEKDFETRKKFLPTYDWNTRFMVLTNPKSPGKDDPIPPKANFVSHRTNQGSSAVDQANLVSSHGSHPTIGSNNSSHVNNEERKLSSKASMTLMKGDSQQNLITAHVMKESASFLFQKKSSSISIRADENLHSSFKAEEIVNPSIKIDEDFEKSEDFFILPELELKDIINGPDVDEVVTGHRTENEMINNNETNILSSFDPLKSPSFELEELLKNSQQLKNSNNIITVPKYVEIKGPSEALKKYEDYVNAEFVARKYYEGKRHSNQTSKFRLKPVLDDVDELVNKLENDRKSIGNYFSDIALFDSLYPNATKQQRQQILNHADDNGVKKNLNCYKDIIFSGIDREVIDSTSMGVIPTNSLSLRTNQLKLMESKTASSINVARWYPLGRTNTTSLVDNPYKSLIKHEEGVGDQDLLDWQSYTVESILKDKLGPKKTLPVLVTNTVTTFNNKHKGSKSKRWGRGTLVDTSGKTEDAAIDGPPSYLDVYKNNFKLHWTAQDRDKAREAVQAVNKERKIF